MRHQDQGDRILRVCIGQGWDQVRPEQNRRHTRDVYRSRQGNLQRFTDLMTYLAAYIPHFADKLSTLPELLKRYVPCVWHADMSISISSESCLSYYTPQTETVLEVDASQKGLGACLLQDNKPISSANHSSS